MLNEIAWAEAELQQPHNVSACNSLCQGAHDSFLLRIQQGNSSLPASTQSARKLLQSYPGPFDVNTCVNCCWQPDAQGNINYAHCPDGVAKCTTLPATPPPAPAPPCNGVMICDSCSAQDSTPCADVVRDDLPNTRITGYDCTTCDNTAALRGMAGNGGSGSGSSTASDIGNTILSVLRIAIAFF